MANSGIKNQWIRLGLVLILAAVLTMGSVLPGGVQAAGTVENGLILSKTASYDESTDSAAIRLEAYVTGTVTTETVQEDIPCDIVLVLDFSNSMMGKFTNEAQTRGEALQAAVNHFIDSVAEKYVEGQTEHRISLIYYNGEGAAEGNSAKVENDWTAVTAANVPELKITDEERTAWIVSGTHTDQGMSKALAQLNELDMGGQVRSRVVVLFTDGELSDYKADDAINTAKRIKAMGCTVYTVATHEKASAAADPGLGDQVTIAQEDGNGDVAARYINAVMHSISSNYLEMTAAADNVAPKQVTFSNAAVNPAVDINGNGVIDETEPGYYMVATSTASLDTVFQSIASSIQSGSASMELDSSAVVKDVVSDYFDLPGDVSAVAVEIYECLSYDAETGMATWSDEGTALSAAVTFDTASKSVNITGFDFSKNFVSEKGRDEEDAGQAGDFHGRKLVITFHAPVREGFLGGNGVPTNGSATGVYSGGTLVEAFEEPVVDVPVQTPAVSAPDHKVYLLGGKTDEQLKAGITVTAAGQTISLDPAVNYGLQTWQNAFVNISADDMSSFGNLTADAAYTARVTFTPKESGLYGATSGAATGNIDVYKPMVTYQDSSIVLGDGADYEKDNFVSTLWMHGDTPASSDMGPPPSLSYSYDPAAGKFQADTSVQVSVMLGTADVTGETVFFRSGCSYDGCSNPAQTGVSGTDENRVNFVVHVLRYDLTISKRAEGLPEDKVPQSFTFTVVDAKEEVHTVTVSNNGAATITLPAGEATVTERKEAVEGYDLTVKVNGTDVTNGAGEATAAYRVSSAGTVEFVNSYARKTTSVTIVKTVSGNLGSRSEVFSFTVTMKDVDNRALTFTHEGNTGQSAAFSLKHGESAVLTDVPVGAVVTVREMSGGYLASAEVNGASVPMTEGSLAFTVLDTEADHVVVNNHKQAPVDTGLALDSLPYLLILAGVGAVGVIWFVRKRRNEAGDL